jgi:Putative beta-lactamase-inhibitor-like, PepSY-like
MKVRMNGLLVAVVALVTASCGNNSSGDNDKDTVTLTNTEVVTIPIMTPIEVPVGIKTNFEQAYPQATNVRWEYYRPSHPPSFDWEWSGWPQMDTMDYVTHYNWQGYDYTSWYDDQGTWVGTVTTVTDHASLPAAVNSTINSQYNGYTITSVKKENDKNRVAYEISLENGTDNGKLLIDENGKIMKKKINAGGNEMKSKMNPKDSV